MAQSGFTPISLYFSATGAAVPTAGNLVAGELALNTNDGKLYFKNSSGVVTLLAGSTSGPAGGSTTQVQYNNAGVLAGITGATSNGTALTLVAPNLGSPFSVGTMPAFTLGGTVSGGGNQINNVIIGTTTPLAGAFTTVTASSNISADNAFLGGDLRLPQTGRAIFNGATASDYIIGPTSGTINSYIASSLKTSLTSTGLAVTGTLSSTLGATIQGLTVGLGAGAVATNTAVGVSALAANVSGSANTAVGYQTLVTATAGVGLTGVGYQALNATTGSYNTGIGWQSGFNTSSGTRNTFLGVASGYNSTTGQSNTYIGYTAGPNATANATGAYNTAVGDSALFSNTTASYNTAVGYQAGYTNTIGGVTAFGSFSLYTNSTGTNLTALGQNALYYCTVSDNTAVGYAAGFSTSTGQYNAFFGGREPTANLATGQNNTLGSNNSAFGHGALAKNTTASNNTAVGYQAGYTQTTGSGGGSTFLGYRAGYAGNGYQQVMVGFDAGLLSTGSNNTFMGHEAGSAMTSGLGNTLIGRFNGNQDGLDIRALSDYIVLSDGNGARQITMKEGQTLALDSAVPNAGTGITFPADATTNPSANANTLDDYEEGTWTPTVTALVGSITTVTGQAGNYTKIGNRVIIEFYFNITSIGTATVAIGVSNLPFVPNVSNINYYTAPTRIRSSATASVNSEWDSADSKIYIYTTPVASVYYGTMSYIV